MPTYRRRSSFGLNISKPGKNLIILILLGLVIGGVTSFFKIDGFPAILYLVQFNYLVFHGAVWSLVTSIIVVDPFAPGYLGEIDVLFNSISVFFVDGLLRNTYTTKQYFAVFLLTGIAGNLVSLFGEPIFIESFGASGGIFGLVAGAVTADYAMNRKINTWLVMWFVFIFIYSSVGGSVDIFAHLGGALTGLLAGYLIGRSRSRTSHY